MCHHDVVVVICLRLDDHLAPTIVEVRLTPIAEQMLANVATRVMSRRDTVAVDLPAPLSLLPAVQMSPSRTSSPSTDVALPRHVGGSRQNPDVPLVIDAAVAGRPDETDLNAWLCEQRVFVSSVMAGMADLRRAVADAVRETGATPVYFEDFGGRDDDAESAYLGEVASSTIYLGILSSAYGPLQKTRRSATHEEYREAERLGLHISVWVDRNADARGDQLSFRDEVRLFHTTGSYTDIDDLARSVVRRLREIATADLSPWVKLGDLVFRARSVHDNGNRLELVATIRDQVLLAEIERLRPGDWSKRVRRLTYNGQSVLVRVLSVGTTAKTARSSEVVLTMERIVDAEVGTPMSISFGSRTYAPEETAELLVRKALFGDSVPRALLTIGGRIDNPFEALPRIGLSDELQRAVIRLLLTEALVVSGRVARVVRMSISPDGPAGRRAIIGWASPARRGQPSALGEAEGILDLPSRA